MHILRQAHRNVGREPPATNSAKQDRNYALSADFSALRQMFVNEGFAADDVRIWYQPCNWWFRDGQDYWESMSILIPEEGRDEVIKAEMARLFDETRT